MTVEEIILFGIGVFCIYFLKNEKYKSNKILKNIAFTIFLIDGYFLLVFRVLVPRENILKNPDFINYFMSFLSILMALAITIMIWKFGKELMEENQLTNLMWMLSYIVLVFSFSYFIIYRYDNVAFMYVNDETERVKEWYELAFDFLYYSFSRGLTFGGGTLEPMSLLAKLCSMVQTVVFYFFIGKGLVDYKKDRK
ncbi:hypothetical protein [Sporosarcina sp. FSL K6-3457]|uniref:hypothetical protein n=1 Tax=Sporosarcina sp. FSL K6-3457 TaxID=2978204 RepID=UPI0030F8787D